MPVVEYKGHRCELAEGETLLDGLLRHEVSIPYACRTGVCHSCLVRRVEGPVPERAQRGLKPTLRARGYLLACCCEPREDLTVAPPDDPGVEIEAVVRSIEQLGGRVVRVRIEADGLEQWRAGQFLNLVRPGDQLTRSYSIANLPDADGYVELHVRRVPHGRMSGWIAEKVQPGERLRLRGPAGDCFYLPEARGQDLLLAGTGTGLAPLYGVARDALRHGHKGRIELFHGAVGPEGLYLVEALRELAATHAHFHYTPCVLRAAGGNGALQVGPIDRIVLERNPDLQGKRIYLCGDPDLVHAMRRKVFLAGASRQQIHADAFLMAPPP